MNNLSSFYKNNLVILNQIDKTMIYLWVYYSVDC